MADITAEDVKKWRAAASLNQTEFGYMLGLSRASIARMETGGDIPSWMKFALGGWVQFAEDRRIYSDKEARETQVERRMLQDRAEAIIAAHRPRHLAEALDEVVVEELEPATEARLRRIVRDEIIRLGLIQK